MNSNAAVHPVRLPVHCDCEVLPPPSLVQELVAVREVARGERTELRNGTLTVARTVEADITVPLVTSYAGCPAMTWARVLLPELIVP